MCKENLTRDNNSVAKDITPQRKTLKWQVNKGKDSLLVIRAGELKQSVSPISVYHTVKI